MKNSNLQRTLLPVSLIAASLLIIPATQAAEKIGVARSAVNSVTGEINHVKTRVSAGDQVFHKEVIRTAPRASAQLVFDDATSLSVGSNSRVILDNFVYQPGSSASRIVFKTTRGAFRFVTGKAPKRAYRVETPTATVGVRGTDFDVYVDRYKTSMILLRSGGVHVCHRRTRACLDLNTGRTYALVTTQGLYGPFPWTGRSPSDILFGGRPRPGGQSSGGDDNNGNNTGGVQLQEEESPSKGGGGSTPQ